MRQGVLIQANDKLDLLSRSVFDAPSKQEKRALKEEREQKGDPSQPDYLGPWAGRRLNEEEQVQQLEIKERLREIEEDRKQKKEKEETEKKEKVPIISNFYGDQEKDYQGRSWLLPERHVKSVLFWKDLPQLLYSQEGEAGLDGTYERHPGDSLLPQLRQLPAFLLLGREDQALEFGKQEVDAVELQLGIIWDTARPSRI